MAKAKGDQAHNLPKLAFSIPEFCIAHGISESHYYGLKERKLAPREMEVGNRRMVSVEAAAEWRREREGRAAA